MFSVYVVLLHYPIRNRQGQVVTTAVTNMDIHDIARSCCTYGVKKYFIVTPLEVQHGLVDRILAHWKLEKNREYHPDRSKALGLIELAYTFENVKQEIRSAEGKEPEVVLTDAKVLPGSMSFVEYKKELTVPSRMRPSVIVFGTGWGIAEKFYPQADRILSPICGPDNNDGYNHLPVRAAVAVVLDRLLGV
ncbi:MAG: RNA methyltransferase [Bdellovibrio sp.]|nr:RNA methyltransferase [Bdellovibrio sp.]